MLMLSNALQQCLVPATRPARPARASKASTSLIIVPAIYHNQQQNEMIEQLTFKMNNFPLDTVALHLQQHILQLIV